MWTTQYIDLDENRQLLTSGGLGTMGYGFPAAMGAQLGNPEKKVIAISGDGGFQMNIQELETLVRLQLPVKIFIWNNQGYASIRSMQNNNFGGFQVASGESSGLSKPAGSLPSMRRRRSGRAGRRKVWSSRLKKYWMQKDRYCVNL